MTKLKEYIDEADSKIVSAFLYNGIYIIAVRNNGEVFIENATDIINRHYEDMKLLESDNA